MRSKPVIQFTILVTALVGCERSNTDATRFGDQRLSELMAQARDVIQGDDGKWYSEAMDIRNASVAYRQGGGMHANVIYDFRVLKSDKCESEDEAKMAKLTPATEEWRVRLERYRLKDGEWTRVATDERIRR